MIHYCEGIVSKIILSNVANVSYAKQVKVLCRKGLC